MSDDLFSKIQTISRCARLGLALAPWDVLRSGKLRTDAEEEEREKSGEKGRSIMNMQWKRNADEKAMSAALEKVANELGTENIRAGMCPKQAVYVQPFLLIESSRYCVCDAEAPICISDSGRTENRAVDGELGGLGYNALCRAFRRTRECLAIRYWFPYQHNGEWQ